MPKKISKKDSFFEKIPNLKDALGFEEKKTTHLIDRIVLRIRKMFSYDDGAPSLKGRVEEIFPKIDSVHTKLIAIKNNVQRPSHDELRAFIDLILEPIIEQGLALKEQRKALDPFHQVKVLDLYQVWLEKAEFWIGSYQIDSEQSFCRRVNEYIWKDFSLKVERDLKIIEDYIEHAIQSLLISESDKKQMKVSIMRSVSQHIVALASLKRLPKDVAFKDLEEWNRSIDTERQHYFEESLSIIDGHIDEAKPHPTVDEHQHLLDVIALINSIDEQTVTLKHQFHLIDDNPDEKGLIKQKAEILAQEAHRLSLDLRLSQSIVERIEGIQTMLGEILHPS